MYKLGEGKKIISVDDALESHRGLSNIKYVFRGQVNCEWETTPKLLRSKRSLFLQMYEHKLLLILHQNGLDKIPFLSTYDPIEYFSILQHYGLSTRLLDFTNDILIALFFACYDPQNIYGNFDGKLMLFRYEGLPEIDLGLTKTDDFPRVIGEIEYTEKYKGRFFSNELFFIKPFIKTPRHRKQDGCFLLFPSTPPNEQDKGYASLEKIMKETHKIDPKFNEDNFVFVFKCIDKSSKKQILQELDEKHQINEKSIYYSGEDMKQYEQLFKIMEKEACEEVTRLLLLPEVEQIIKSMGINEFI